MTKIVTSCKNCKWATYHGKTQIDCEFDLISKYRDAGITVTEAYDEDKEFNVIDRICIYSRPQDTNMSRDEVLEAAKIKYQVICILPNNNVEDFSFCLQSITKQEISPKHITVIKPKDVDMQPFKVTKLLTRSAIPWRYEDCIDNSVTDGDLIDICIDKICYPYYVVLKNNVRLSDNFSICLNKEIEKFTIFSCINMKDISVIPTVYHKQLSGNSFKPLVEKIKEDKELSCYMLNL